MDGLLHCQSQRQAEYVLKRIEQRLRECGLEIHPNKSGIIYCKEKKIVLGNLSELALIFLVLHLDQGGA